MSEQTPRSASVTRSLPDEPNLEWLRSQAKVRLAELRKTQPDAKLAAAQFQLAREYGFSSWRALKSHVDSLTVEGQLFAAARKGDVLTLSALLKMHPDKLHARAKPYEWTLLHTAAQNGHLDAVNLLLDRGLDANTREKGDNTYAMHWAAAAGHVEIVRRLADAGGDVVGAGDDHELEVIGWASCWPGCDDDPHRAVVALLLERGARHHIFSAIALNLADEARRIVARDPSALSRRMSRNEDHQTPLHFAVGMGRREMVELLLDLGADPLAVDGSGYPAVMYATAPAVDHRVLLRIHEMTLAELDSAARGKRAARLAAIDLVAALALREFNTAEVILATTRELMDRSGALHLMAKRGETGAVRWLLARGADVNARWSHWDAEVTPLHMAAFSGSPTIARVLLEAGADHTIRDTKHDSDPLGWAEHFGRTEIVRALSAKR